MVRKLKKFVNWLFSWAGDDVVYDFQYSKGEMTDGGALLLVFFTMWATVIIFHLFVD